MSPQPETAQLGTRTPQPGIEPGRHSPEPLNWRRLPPLRQRMMRALGVPVAAAATLFIAILLLSIGTVWFRSHVPAAEAVGADFSEHSRRTLSEASDPEGTAAAPKLYIHVVGEVAEPGVVEIEAGARVSAALEAAGGATEEAALEGINLARQVVDGEQIIVPNVNEAPVPVSAQPGGAASAQAKVSLNTADAGALDTLPKIGPATAARIIEWRQANGGFSTLEQLLEVSGIGQKTFDGLRDRITL